MGIQGPDVQSIVSLTSPLVVKMLTALVVQYLIQLFFQQKILAYTWYLMIKVLTIH